jgi:hypothetical protein
MTCDPDLAGPSLWRCQHKPFNAGHGLYAVPGGMQWDQLVGKRDCRPPWGGGNRKGDEPERVTQQLLMAPRKITGGSGFGTTRFSLGTGTGRPARRDQPRPGISSWLAALHTIRSTGRRRINSRPRARGGRTNHGFESASMAHREHPEALPRSATVRRAGSASSLDQEACRSSASDLAGSVARKHGEIPRSRTVPRPPARSRPFASTVMLRGAVPSKCGIGVCIRGVAPVLRCRASPAAELARSGIRPSFPTPRRSLKPPRT